MTDAMNADARPVLYSFRRCPYAIRARMALDVSEQLCELREVDLKDKPVSMLEASPKGTVPVLVLPQGAVLEQSLDIMTWTLGERDPDDWLMPDWGSYDDMIALIETADTGFKDNLDRYKYAVRFDGADPR